MPCSGHDPVFVTVGTRHRPSRISQNNVPLTCATLIKELKEALQQAEISAFQYSGHRFRIRAATTAAKRGFEDSLILTQGRWKSAAYKLYIKIRRKELVAASAALLCNSRGTNPYWECADETSRNKHVYECMLFIHDTEMHDDTKNTKQKCV